MGDDGAGQRPRRRLVVSVREELLRDALVAALHGEALAVEGLTRQDLLGRLPVTGDVDLVIVDSGGSEPGDWSIVRRIRSASDVSVLALSASGGLGERLGALRAGADGVLSQPFSLAELVANVAAMLRRCSRPHAEHHVLGDLVLDAEEHTVMRGGKALYLTALEFSLLQTFCQNHRRVLSKTQLLAIVWGFDEFDPNVVEVHVSALRRKMEARGPRLLHTVRGVGYVLRADLPAAGETFAAG